MKNPLDFYTQEIIKLKKQASILKKKHLKLSVFRFLIFLITAFLIYLNFGQYPQVFIIAFFCVLLFSFLVVKHTNLKKKRNIVDAKIKINTTEIKVLNRDFFHLDTGEEFINPTHFYSNDIDLFGKGSFFQYLNRTVTAQGKNKLANILTENNIDTIKTKQEVIKELSEKVKWRQHFSALASLVTANNKTDFLIDWAQNYTSVLPNFLTKIQAVFSGISLILIGLVSFGLISFSFITIWFFIGLIITVKFIKKTQKLYTETNEISELFKQYYPLLHEIEKESFKTDFLKEKQNIITSENKKASVIFKAFSKTLDAFDQRNNILISVVGNGLFLSEIKVALKTEKWILNYKHTVKNWFEVVAFFDAQNSLANFNFNHPKFVFPEIKELKTTIQSEQLGHPLLNSEKRIDNNFSINKAQFFIITGANMAGKSTFLRTVSLAIVMANCGLPVCAKRFEYAPIKLITSMRTSDSLTEEASYFYSELKRLKFIVNQIEQEKYFIILDEILKGTNSKDKAIGSKKFVEKLSKSNSTGIIATHDISLCELENEFSEIKNFYFDAEIIADELHFDYTLKNGVCKNMNASFLLKKMEII